VDSPGAGDRESGWEMGRWLTGHTEAAGQEDPDRGQKVLEWGASSLDKRGPPESFWLVTLFSVSSGPACHSVENFHESFPFAWLTRPDSPPIQAKSTLKDILTLDTWVSIPSPGQHTDTPAHTHTQPVHKKSHTHAQILRCEDKWSSGQSRNTIIECSFVLHAANRQLEQGFRGA